MSDLIEIISRLLSQLHFFYVVLHVYTSTVWMMKTVSTFLLFQLSFVFCKFCKLLSILLLVHLSFHWMKWKRIIYENKALVIILEKIVWKKPSPLNFRKQKLLAPFFISSKASIKSRVMKITLCIHLLYLLYHWPINTNDSLNPTLITFFYLQKVFLKNEILIFNIL